MKRLLRWLVHPLLWTLIGVVCLVALVWLGGPLVSVAGWHPLETGLARAGLIVLLLALWLGRRGWRALHARLVNRQLFDALHGTPAGPDASAGAPAGAPAEAVRHRFDEALATLRDQRLGEPVRGWRRLLGNHRRKYVYQLPWYLFIGAPGSGKTTALLNSGLRFPLAGRLGSEPVRGVGGTRHCDWWFTDQAVLIDTAGRYVTQDSDRDRDATEWRAFLGLLRRHRPRQPINGVLVTVSVPDLLQAAPAERDRQADAVHARLRELADTLGHAFPVYLLVTKADLLAGFVESFDALDREQREQVWGFTFDWKADPLADTFSSERLQTEYARLLERLQAQALDRLQAERDPGRRTLIQGFPAQLAALRPSLAAFAERAFAPSRLSVSPTVRGVYWASGIQEGNPIDRVMGALARSFGLQGRMLPPLRPSGRAYFLGGLLRQVVFAEARLAGTNLRRERRLARMKWTAAAGCVALAAGAATAWTVSYLHNTHYVGQVDAKARELQDVLAKRAGAIRADDSLRSLLPVYADVRSLARTADVPDPTSASTGWGWGLFQGPKLDAAADQAYHGLLQATLGPALGARLEAALRRGVATPQLQYETLRTYVMLHTPERLDIEAVRGWLAFDLESAPAATLAPDERARLLTHADALLARDGAMQSVRPDEKLLAQVRASLARTPFAQRVYERLKQQGIADDLPAFRITAAGGPTAALVFVRASGRPLSEGVPGLYSHDGYHKRLNRALDEAVGQLAEEEVWVLGLRDSDNAKRAADARGRAELAASVRRLYLQDYAETWEQFVADLRLVPGDNLAQSIQTARLLSAPDSPLPKLLRAIVHEVTLGARLPDLKAAADTAGAVGAAAGGSVGGAIANTRDRLNRLMGAGDKLQPALPAGLESIVDERFEALRRLVRAPGPNQPAPIDRTVAALGEVYTLLSGVDTAIRSGSPPPLGELPRILADAGRLPQPVRGMVEQLASSAAKQAGNAQRENASIAVKTAVSERCLAAVTGRYPFARGSRNDVPMDDFVQLFAPGGVLDAVFQKELAPLVDTTQKPWRLRANDQGTAPAALVQFQHAAEIRRAFFGTDAKLPMMRAQVRTLELDPGVAQVALEVDGQVLQLAPGQPGPQPLQWPGAQGGTHARLQVQAAAGASKTLTFEGPWALLRLFDAAQIEATGTPERFRASWLVDGHRVRVEVNAASVHHPFRLPALQAFRCPGPL